MGCLEIAIEKTYSVYVPILVVKALILNNKLNLV